MAYIVMATLIGAQCLQLYSNGIYIVMAYIVMATRILAPNASSHGGRTLIGAFLRIDSITPVPALISGNGPLSPVLALPEYQH